MSNTVGNALCGVPRTIRTATERHRGRSLREVVGLAVCSMIAVSLAGCGTSNELNRQSITGTIHLNGTLLDSGNIRFLPQKRERGVSSGAMIRDGHYAIDAEKGLPPGEYLVRSYWAEVSPEKKPRDPNNPVGQVGRERIPPDFNTKSQHTITVTDGGANRFDFNINAG